MTGRLLQSRQALSTHVGLLQGMRQTLTLAWRSLLQIRHNPWELGDFSIQPVLFLLLFMFVLGGAIAGSTAAYLRFILPGVIVMNMVWVTVYVGHGLNTDLTKGVVDPVAAGRRHYPRLPAGYVPAGFAGDDFVGAYRGACDVVGNGARWRVSRLLQPRPHPAIPGNVRRDGLPLTIPLDQYIARLVLDDVLPLAFTVTIEATYLLAVDQRGAMDAHEVIAA